MRASIENMLNQIKEFFARMERKDKIRLAILAAVVVILAIILIAYLSRTTYVPLYTAQSSSEASAIIEALRDMGVNYQTDGLKILVPEGTENELRITLSGQGIIGSAGLNTTYLDSALGFNVTDSFAKELYARQTGEDIRTQILMSDNIRNATVTVNPGEYSPYVISQGITEATASVMLEVRNGATLTNAEAQRIADLVKTNVPGLKYENITITDTKWNYYQIGDSGADLSTDLAMRNTLKNQLQTQYQIKGEQMFGPIYGLENLKISVFVKLNFDKEFTQIIEYSPPIAGELDGMIRSSMELYENQRNAGAAGGIPGTDSNAMGTVEYPYATLEDGDEYRKTQLETNFELNETFKTIEHEQGYVEYVSVAILINEAVVDDDYTVEISNLAEMGLGIPANNIVVEIIEFKNQGMTLMDYEKLRQEEEALARRRALLEMIIKYAVIVILIVAVLLLARMIIKVIRPEPEPSLTEGIPGIDYLVDDSQEDYYDDVELRQKSSALEQIERFIDKDPASVAQLLRNWLTDD